VLVSFLTIFAIIRMRDEVNIVTFVGACRTAFFLCLVCCVEFIAVSVIRNTSVLFLQEL